MSKLVVIFKPYYCLYTARRIFDVNRVNACMMCEMSDRLGELSFVGVKVGVPALAGGIQCDYWEFRKKINFFPYSMHIRVDVSCVQ